MVLVNASGVNWVRLFRSIIAALLTTASILPKAAIALSTIFCGVAGSERSAIHNAALFPN